MNTTVVRFAGWHGAGLRLLAGLAVAGGGALLILTGLTKALDSTSFALTLSSHGLFPEPVVGQIASAFIVLEILVGVTVVGWLLVWDRLALAAGVLAGFAAAFGWYAFALVLFPPPEPVGCGCGFSATQTPANWPIISTRSAVAAVVFAAISLCSRRTPGPRSPH